MDVHVQKLSDINGEVRITMTPDELRPHFEAAYIKFRPKVELKGFRKGKVPLEMVIRLYGEAIEFEAMEGIAGKAFQDAMAKEGIKTVGTPVLKDVHYHRGEDARFLVAFENLPEIKLKKYKKLEVQKQVYRQKPEDLEREIKRLQFRHSTRKDASKVESEEFFVTADIQETDEKGTPLIGQLSKDIELYLADERLFPEFKQVLLNAEIGGRYPVRYTRTNAENEKVPTHAVVTVNKIQKIVYPEITDAWASTITNGASPTVQELRTKVETELKNYWDGQSRTLLVDTLVREVVAKNDFPIPDSFVTTVLDSMVEEEKKNRKQYNITEPLDEQAFRDRNREFATLQAKWHVLRERIIEQEKIAIADEDLDALAEKDSKTIGIDKEKLIAYYKSSERVRDKLLYEKFESFLIANASIKEVELK